MPEAKSLRDLLLIRHHNRKLIDSVNGNLGSALGYKKKTGEPTATGNPAIIIFVPRKIDPKWLKSPDLIPKKLKYPDEDLWCHVDVVEGGNYEEIELRYRNAGNTNFSGVISRTDLLGEKALTPPQLRLRDTLRGWSKKVVPGSQVAGTDLSGSGYYGTLGCFARDKANGALGFLTNQHVADHTGNYLWYAEMHSNLVAGITQVEEYMTDEDRFPSFLDEEDAYYRVDCAFAEYYDPEDGSDLEDAIDPYLNLFDANGVPFRKKMGSTLNLDMDTMGPLGKKVLAVGRTRSLQRGTISAFAYEWIDEKGESNYTDYLIANEEGQQFSDYGDSGKLIVTDDGKYSPVALLWGGWTSQLRSGYQQENWTYAIDINIVLNLLNIEIVRSI